MLAPREDMVRVSDARRLLHGQVGLHARAQVLHHVSLESTHCMCAALLHECAGLGLT